MRDRNLAKLSVAFVAAGRPIHGFIFGFNFLTDIAKVLKSKGCKIYFVQPEGPAKVETEKYFSVTSFKEAEILQLALMPIKKVSPALFTALTSALNYNAFSTLLSLAKKIDAIICDNANYFFPTVLAAKLAKKPLILLFGNILFMKHYKTKESKQLKVNLLLLYTLLTIEKMFATLANKVVTLSKNDEMIVNSWGITQDKIKVIPLSVDLKKVEKKLTSRGRQEKEFLKLEALKAKGTKIIMFHGTLSDLPNLFACRYIVNELAQRISEKYSTVVFVIVGPYPPDDLVNKSDRVIFTGFVRNIFRYIDLADAAVVPVTSGFGVKTKILEYFALSKPVVTTPLGVEGLEVKDMVHCAIAKNLDAFPERLVFLLEHPEIALEMGREARKYVEDKHSLRNYERYFNSIHDMLDAGKDFTQTKLQT